MKVIISKMHNSIMVLLCLILMACHISLVYLTLDKIYGHVFTSNGGSNTSIYIIVFIYMIILFSFMKLFGGFKIGHYRVSEVIYSQILTIIISAVILCLLLLLISQEIYSVNGLFILLVMQVLVSFVWGFMANKIYSKLNKPHKMLLLYGNDPNDLIFKMIKRSDKYNICMTVEENEGIALIKEKLESFDTLIMYDVKEDIKSQLIKCCYEKDKKVYMIPDVSDVLFDNPIKIDLFDTPVFMYKIANLTTEERFFKRLLDLAIVVPLTIIALPFMLVTAIAIKLYDRGPVIYKQKRLTKNNREFYVYKFRSMKVNAESDGKARLASKEDDRITPVGKVIRAIRFDELPQLWNILNGDMSVVGPRPERPEIADEYYKEFPEFAYRLKVKAGLTGYAQVFGKYNTTPIDKVKLDLIYIKNYTLKLDMKLILMTFKILFMSESTEGVERFEDGEVARNK